MKRILINVIVGIVLGAAVSLLDVIAWKAILITMLSILLWEIRGMLIEVTGATYS